MGDFGMIVFIVLALVVTSPLSAPSLDNKCVEEYSAEHYYAGAATCEYAAKIHDLIARRFASKVDADSERFLGATLRMEFGKPLREQGRRS
jgi:hypothetical protein